jgi:hypothetical protein
MAWLAMENPTRKALMAQSRKAGSPAGEAKAKGKAKGKDKGKDKGQRTKLGPRKDFSPDLDLSLNLNSQRQKKRVGRLCPSRRALLLGQRAIAATTTATATATAAAAPMAFLVSAAHVERAPMPPDFSAIATATEVATTTDTRAAIARKRREVKAALVATIRNTQRREEGQICREWDARARAGAASRRARQRCLWYAASELQRARFQAAKAIALVLEQEQLAEQARRSELEELKRQGPGDGQPEAQLDALRETQRANLERENDRLLDAIRSLMRRSAEGKEKGKEPVPAPAAEIFDA